MWTRIAQSLTEVANRPISQFWLDAALKATVLLLAAIGATALLRRQSAALRHRLWCLTFAALVMLPGLSAALPKWRLAVLPYTSPLATREGSQSPPPPEATVAADPEFAKDGFAAQDGLPLAEREDDGTLPSDAQRRVLPALAPAAPRFRLRLITLWLGGALLAVSPLAVGLLRTLQLRRKARAIDDASWASLLEELRGRLRLARRVELIETEAAVMPMTWGLRRPVVLLPRQAREWPDRLRRIVLLHELAHIKRCDVAFQTLGRLACALYWFHPLAWYALRRLRIERELACDDCVVHTGERASDYAAELLQVARSYRPIRFAAAVAMAQRSNLEHRLLALFDRARSHLPLSARGARLLMAGMLVLATTIAAVRLAPRAAADDEKQAGGAADSQGDLQPRSSPAKPNAGAHRVRGRVVDASDRPVAGARVRVFRVDTEATTWVQTGHVIAEGRSDAEGVFSVQHSDGAPFATREQFIRPNTIAIADADGYSFDWIRVQPGEKQAILRLTGDDAPIEGRVLDLEGRPIPGVTISVHEVSGGAQNLDRWIEAAKHNPTAVDEDWIAKPIDSKNGRAAPTVARYPGNKNLQLGRPDLLPSAVTDAKGNFQLIGLGTDRLVRLELQGPRIAKTWLNVVTHDMAAVPYPTNDPRFRVQTCFGRRFDFTTEPDQPITGVVRDVDKQQPLAGVAVRLNQYADSLLFVEGFLSAVTNEQGRYTLRGVPKPHHPERSHRLRIVPRDDQPYFRTEVHVAKLNGLDAATCDVMLRRAIWLRGRVTDTVTGRPVHGLVEYYPFLSNKAAAAYANFNAGLLSVHGDGYPTRDDGTYQLPVLPGRGLVAFIAKDADRYPEADGADGIAGLRQQSGNRLNVYHLDSPDLRTALREVDPPRDAFDFDCDIGLKSLGIARIALVDADGQPVQGAATRRLAPLHVGAGNYDNGWSEEPLPADTAEIIGPRDQSRTLMFLHRQRKVAAAVSLSSDTDPPEQVVLRACGSISGRILDLEGKPVPECFVEVNAAAGAGIESVAGWARATFDLRHQLARLPTNRDGRFHVDLVPPGIVYVVSGKLRPAEVKKTTPVVQAGQSLDLGDLVLEAPEAATNGQAAPIVLSAAASSEATKNETVSSLPEKAEITTLRGRVLLPDGKPAARAKLYLSYANQDARKPRLLGAAGDDGRFQFEVDNAKLGESLSPDPRAGANIAAVAEGFGLQWLDLDQRDDNGEYTLRLVNDVPIHGRIVDVDGQGIAGAKLRLRKIAVPPNGLDGYIEATRNGSFFSFDRTRDSLPGTPVEITLDPDGRFTLRGVGAERVVEILVEGPNIEWWYIKVMSRKTDAVPVGHGVPGTPFLPRPDRVYGAEFGHVAPPSRLIMGTLRDGESGKPIAGVKVQSRGLYSSMHLPQTDAEGRFELLGHPKAPQYELLAVPDGLPYFEGSVKVQDTPGLEPLSVEMALLRGTEARGRMTFAPDGQPGPGTVEYHPLRPNPDAVKIVPRAAQRPLATATIGTDGRYRLPVLPGPGVLAFRARGLRRLLYAPAYVGRDELDNFFHDGQDHGDERVLQTESGRSGPAPIFQTNFNRLILINPPRGAELLETDATIESGRTAKGMVYDPDGQPLAGAMTSGLGGRQGIGDVRLDTPAFTVAAMHPRRTRELVFRHPDKRWGKFLIVPGDQVDVLHVRLERCGEAEGRLLDAEGMPLAHASISVSRHQHAPTMTVETNDRGIFRIDNLIPGLKYDLNLLRPAQRLGQPRAIQTEIVVAPGEQKALGDVGAKARHVIPSKAAER